MYAWCLLSRRFCPQPLYIIRIAALFRFSVSPHVTYSLPHYEHYLSVTISRSCGRFVRKIKIFDGDPSDSAVLPDPTRLPHRDPKRMSRLEPAPAHRSAAAVRCQNRILVCRV